MAKAAPVTWDTLDVAPCFAADDAVDSALGNSDFGVMTPFLLRAQ